MGGERRRDLRVRRGRLRVPLHAQRRHGAAAAIDYPALRRRRPPPRPPPPPPPPPPRIWRPVVSLTKDGPFRPAAGGGMYPRSARSCSSRGCTTRAATLRRRVATPPPVPRGGQCWWVWSCQQGRATRPGLQNRHRAALARAVFFLVVGIKPPQPREKPRPQLVVVVPSSARGVPSDDLLFHVLGSEVLSRGTHRWDLKVTSGYNAGKPCGGSGKKVEFAVGVVSRTADVLSHPEAPLEDCARHFCLWQQLVSGGSGSGSTSSRLHVSSRRKSKREALPSLSDRDTIHVEVDLDRGRVSFGANGVLVWSTADFEGDAFDWCPPRLPPGGEVTLLSQRSSSAHRDGSASDAGNCASSSRSSSRPLPSFCCRRRRRWVRAAPAATCTGGRRSRHDGPGASVRLTPERGITAAAAAGTGRIFVAVHRRVTGRVVARVLAAAGPRAGRERGRQAFAERARRGLDAHAGHLRERVGPLADGLR